jgi:hypothetical protein
MEGDEFYPVTNFDPEKSTVAERLLLVLGSYAVAVGARRPRQDVDTRGELRKKSYELGRWVGFYHTDDLFEEPLSDDIFFPDSLMENSDFEMRFGQSSIVADAVGDDSAADVKLVAEVNRKESVAEFSVDPNNDTFEKLIAKDPTRQKDIGLRFLLLMQTINAKLSAGESATKCWDWLDTFTDSSAIHFGNSLEIEINEELALFQLKESVD